MAPLKSFLASCLLALPFAVGVPLDITSSLEDVADKISSSDDGVVGISSVLRPLVTNPDASNIISNRYIVVYNDTFDDDAITVKETSWINAVKKRNIGKRSTTGHLLSTDVHTFKMNKWRAMALDADDDMVQDLYNSDEVAYIEADTKINLTAAIAQTNAPPGLRRLSHAEPNDQTYIFDDSAGENITAYVVDTGIMIDHTEFEGRATFGANFVNSVVCDCDVAFDLSSH